MTKSTTTLVVQWLQSNPLYVWKHLDGVPTKVGIDYQLSPQEDGSLEIYVKHFGETLSSNEHVRVLEWLARILKTFKGLVFFSENKFTVVINAQANG